VGSVMRVDTQLRWARELIGAPTNATHKFHTHVHVVLCRDLGYGVLVACGNWNGSDPVRSDGQRSAPFVYA